MAFRGVDQHRVTSVSKTLAQAISDSPIVTVSIELRALVGRMLDRRGLQRKTAAHNDRYAAWLCPGGLVALLY